MYFEHKNLHNFTEENLKELKAFTFKDGMARPVFEKASNGILKDAEAYSLTILRHDYKFVIGWSLIVPKETLLGSYTYCSQESYMCFIRPLFRKKGMGRKIFEESTKNISKNLIVYGWDEKSKSFYSKIKQENSNNKEIEIW